VSALPAHRTLNFSKFVSAISPEILERYLGHFNWEHSPEGWQLMNPDALREFLDQAENGEASAIIEEEFRRINDLCSRGMNLVVRAYKEFGRDFDESLSAEELSMRLFLDHEDAFDYAWSRYLLFAGTPKLSFFSLGTDDLKFTAAKLKKFEDDLRAWFGESAKGECFVKNFKDARDTVILISRGSYVRTVACWREEEIGFTSYRPASEDVLVYNRKTGILTMKASLEKDRTRYLDAFSTHLAGDSKIAERAGKRKLYSLAPIQDGSFEFAGDGEVTGVDLVKVRLRLDGIEQPEIQIKSDDVRRSVDAYLKVPLRAGTLTYASFRFHLKPPGRRRTKVTFEIEPPLRTDLAEKKYADIIERYLIEQKVKLG